MPGHHPARSRRATERKGDVRERATLDTCKALLAQKGYDAMTVGDIA
jgi:AcrR family transcriptional regulator